MSFIKLNLNAEPATPAANKVAIWFDTTLKRMRLKDQTGVKRDLSPAGLENQNLLINGGFQIAQRQVPGTLTSYALTTGRTFAADRYGMTIQTSSLQYARVDTNAAPESGLQARFYGQFKQITAVGKFAISQVVEGTNCLHVRGNQVRLQVKMKASAAKTIRLGLLQLTSAGTIDTIPAVFASAMGADTVDPTWGTNLALIAPDVVIQDTAATQAIRNSAVDCSVTTAWQMFGGIFTLPTNYKNLIPVIFTDAQFAVNDILNVGEHGLYDKVGAVDWEERPIDDQLEDCQRYFCKSFNVDTNPVQNGGLVGVFKSPVVIAGAVATSWVGALAFPVPTRAAPTMTFFNPSAANAFVRNIAAATDATATSAEDIGERGCTVLCTGLAAWTVGQKCGVHFTANAEL
jgi:hypothetical protein